MPGNDCTAAVAVVVMVIASGNDCVGGVGGSVAAVVVVMVIVSGNDCGGGGGSVAAVVVVYGHCVWK